jgi:hypothetical protein
MGGDNAADLHRDDPWAHQERHGDHAVWDSLCGHGKEEKSSPSAALVLGGRVAQGHNEAVQEKTTGADNGTVDELGCAVSIRTTQLAYDQPSAGLI